MQFTLGQIGIEFAAVPVDAYDPHDQKELDLTGYNSIKMEFTRPDGTRFTKDARPRNTDLLTKTDIIYHNNTAPSILNQTGYWEYRWIVEKNGVYAKGQSISFWVVS